MSRARVSAFLLAGSVCVFLSSCSDSSNRTVTEGQAAKAQLTEERKKNSQLVADNARLTQENAELTKELQSSTTERDELKKRSDEFDLSDDTDSTKPYDFDQGIINLSDAIIAALRKGKPDSFHPVISIEPITLGVPRLSSSTAGQATSDLTILKKADPESLDNLGGYITENIKNRLTEHNVVAISDRASSMINGFYVLDTPSTIRLFIRMYGESRSIFNKSFTRTVNVASLNKSLLHYLNQCDDPGPK